MIFYGVLKALGVKWCGGCLRHAAERPGGRGEGGIIGAEPAARVFRIAELVKEVPELGVILREGDVRILRAEIAKHPVLAGEVRYYLEAFDDHCLGGLAPMAPCQARILL